MHTWTFPGLLAVLILACLLSGIWLVLHLTALASRFRGKADVVPSPRPPRASRLATLAVLGVFSASLAGILAMQVIAITA